MSETSPPEYRRDAVKIAARPRPGAVALENIFFAFSTVLIFAFGIIVAEQIDWSWTLVVYAVAFWLIIAYLALPRLHRILTAIYVPGYFIGRTRTSDGLLGDPVNLAFNGSGAQIHAAMQDAGWTLADPVNVRSSIAIIGSSLLGRSYDRAPVSPLVLFGASQAFAYQKEVAGSPSKRHHIRFWRCPVGWLLPGGHQVDWLAAATYDKSVGLSLFTLQVTHKIDKNIDVERDFVSESLLHSDSRIGLRRLENFSTGYHSRNGGGDVVTTDGALPIIDVGALPSSGVAPAPSEKRRTRGTPSTAEVTAEVTEAVSRAGERPFSILAALVLSIASVAFSIQGQIQQLQSQHGEMAQEYGSQAEADATLWIAIAFVALAHLLTIYLAWRTFKGRRLARWLAIAFVMLSQVSQMAQYLGSVRPSVGALASMGIGLLIIYALTSQTAREWTTPTHGRAQEPTE